jgi:hypothetical protein
MLAPSCRLCVACKQPIDLSQIAALTPPPPRFSLPEVQAVPHSLEPVRFPWRIFLVVLALWVPGAMIVQEVMAPLQSQLVLAGIQVLSSVWVFYDAQEKHVPRALRWGLGSLLLWPLIFPWYLGRRSKPTAPCPFVEAPAGPYVRAILFVLLIVFIFLIFRGPAAK